MNGAAGERPESAACSGSADRWLRPEQWLLIVLGGVVFLAGLIFAWDKAWICDDAFISFRYARNLVEEGSLVYNPGERVEGFTNLLWTLWIAAGLALGVDAAPWATAWGLVAYGGVLVLLLRFHVELRRRLATPRFTIPLGALVAALHPDFHVYATSGLETSAFTFAAFAGYMLVVQGAVDGRPRAAWAGIVLGLCSLLRPDGVIFAGLGGLVLVASRTRWRDVGIYAACSGALWIGATLWRIGYYGDFFPNTYYAKSAYEPWHEQGLRYLELYLLKYGPLLAPWFGVAAVFARSRYDSRVLGASRRWFLIHAAAAAGFTLVYGYYVVRVGGDFMYARMLIPTTPYLAVLFELGLYRLLMVHPVLHGVAAAGLLGSMWWLPKPVAEHVWVYGVTDERSFYNPERVEETEQDAADLAPYLEGLDVRVAFLGTQARVMYLARVPVAIESETGLTDATIARQRLSTRGRVGHEKRADLEYLIVERKAHFALGPAVDHVLGLHGSIPIVTVGFGDVEAFVLHWDPELMRELRQRGARVPDFLDKLDAYIEDMGSRPREEVAERYEKYRLFYFDHHPDPKREARFEERLARP